MRMSSPLLPTGLWPEFLRLTPAQQPAPSNHRIALGPQAAQRVPSLLTVAEQDEKKAKALCTGVREQAARAKKYQPMIRLVL
jgi:hypothetical protein